MSKYLLSTILFVAFISNSNAQSETRQIVFYNVENLFDTLDTAGKNDAEFLPNTKRDWNTIRYNEKLEHINKVFSEFNSPLLFGVCEIENEKVVRDIVSSGALKDVYGVVHIESLDARGIDNAMIYDSTSLELLESGVIRFDMPEGFTPSRDILWAKFKSESDSMYAMINHWPSRRGGQLTSEPKRLIAATAAKGFIDSLININKNVQIVFMGDLNDYPTNKAPQMISSVLNTMITPKSGQYGGTHNYRGEWNVLDHMMVSPGFLKKDGLFVQKKSGIIGEFDYLLTEYKGNIVPFRTYGGGRYLKGYSDHLPVSIELGIK